MTLVDVVSHSASRWGLPVAIFGSVYGIFAFLDSVSAPEARKSLTEFLESYRYESYLGMLPEIIQKTFNKIFGDRHFSVKCIISSIVLSVGSLVLMFAISFIWNYEDFMKVASDTATEAAKLKTSDNTAVKKLIEWFSETPSWLLWSYAAITWVIWCLIPDYIALLKIRIILIVLRYTGPQIFSLIVTGVIDFVLGLIVFMISFSLLQILILGITMYYSGQITGNLSDNIIGFMIVWGLVFVIETPLLFMKALLIFLVPLANLFWASMLPSIWLWAYVIASLLTRTLLASRGLLRRSVSFLDVSTHPIRSIGVVAASVMAAGSFVMLIALSFV